MFPSLCLGCLGIAMAVVQLTNAWCFEAYSGWHAHADSGTTPCSDPTSDAGTTRTVTAMAMAGLGQAAGTPSSGRRGSVPVTQTVGVLSGSTGISESPTVSRRNSVPLATRGSSTPTPSRDSDVAAPSPSPSRRRASLQDAIIGGGGSGSRGVAVTRSSSGVSSREQSRTIVSRAGSSSLLLDGHVQ